MGLETPLLKTYATLFIQPVAYPIGLHLLLEGWKPIYDCNFTCKIRSLSGIQKISIGNYIFYIANLELK